MTIAKNCVLGRFFTALGGGLARGRQTSALVRFFAALWAALCRGWENSAVGRGLDRLERSARAGAGGSAVCRFLWRDGAVVKSWPDSLSCRVLTALINLPCAFAKWVYRAGKQVLDASLVFRALSAVGGRSFLVLGLFLMVMLVVPHGSWDNLYGVAGAVAVTGLFILGSAARPQNRLELDRLGPWYILFMGVIVYGLVGSLSPSLSLRYFLFHGACFLIVLLAVSSVHRVEQLQLTVALAAAGITVAALYGCYQGAVGVEASASLTDLALNEGMPGRIYSFFDNPNNFAELLAMLIPFLLALFLNAGSWKGKLLALLALVPCGAAIGMTYGRASWIGLAVAVAVFLTLQNWRYLPLFLVLGLCAIPLLPESIYHRILTIGNLQDSSTRYRLAIYEASENLIRDYGLRGVGLDPDVMQRVFRAYQPLYDGNFPVHTHNNYLQMWLEVGILGGVSFLAVLLAQVKRGVKSFYACTDRKVKNLLAAAVGGFCGILVVGLAEYTWFYPRNMFIYWFLFGVIAACVKLGGEGKTVGAGCTRP